MTQAPKTIAQQWDDFSPLSGANVHSARIGSSLFGANAHAVHDGKLIYKHVAMQCVCHALNAKDNKN